MEIFAKLGIDWKLILAQAVNFAILFFVLRRFAYRPMLRFLEQRTSRIEQGIKDADAAKEKLSEMQEKEQEVLARAKEEARRMLTSTEEAAKKRDAERLAETEARVKRLLAQSEEKIAEERERALREAKQELAALVVSATEKVLKEKIDPEKDRALLERVIG